MAGIEIAKKSDLEGKANVSHNHAIADITNLQTALDGKAAGNHNHNGVYQPAGNYANANHNHDGVYAPVGHAHSYNDLTDRPTIPSDTNQLTNSAGFITASYDNSTSGLTATDIQSAIDELKALIDGLGGA